jgi:glucose-6-phosphate isomerase
MSFRSSSSCSQVERRRERHRAEAVARQHRMLLANGLAQSQALMQGRASADEPHRDFPGNRPSTTLLLERLTPRSLGALLALYEHRVFTSGAVWGSTASTSGASSSARRWARGSCPCSSPAATAPADLDASTPGLLRRLGATQ